MSLKATVVLKQVMRLFVLVLGLFIFIVSLVQLMGVSLLPAVHYMVNGSTILMVLSLFLFLMFEKHEKLKQQNQVPL
ncbi:MULTISPECIES: hypothetical protein [unclassified Geomicrobium]|uniref:hypothetical protein n=1 Tax=unclassified Geomicrobium TaxID=2628951 RepID=UPI00045ED835|nr:MULTISPECIES: hypothetical protein [unclassified Geomicrobium]GAJ97864.1 hypothetical protein JCM19055_751 [Geomicrobium sp. JCM 19055]GAK08305.1 hypothetical protein JCM19038_2084 [Geomicrobium sp. JCM 19038]